MNRQQLLDKENPTTEEFTIQQLLTAGSKTSLEALRREMSKLDKALYKTAQKIMPFQNAVTCVTIAAKLAAGESVDSISQLMIHNTPTGTIIPEGQKGK